jgi:ribonuclease HI
VPRDDAEIAALELRLLDPATRRRPDEVAALLHPDFLEIGASGRAWDRASMIAALRADPGTGTRVTGLAVHLLAPGVALVTYRTERAARASLWLRDGEGWRVRFHQGTPLPED